MTASISKLLYFLLFIDQSEHHYTTQTTKFNNSLNRSSTILNSVFNVWSCDIFLHNVHWIIYFNSSVCWRIFTGVNDGVKTSAETSNRRKFDFGETESRRPRDRTLGARPMSSLRSSGNTRWLDYKANVSAARSPSKVHRSSGSRLKIVKEGNDISKLWGEKTGFTMHWRYTWLK